jgi:hypothetical protein
VRGLMRTPRGNPTDGVYPKGTDTRLWIRLTRPLELEPAWERAELAAVARVVGDRTGLVHIDVSGRVPGDDEVRSVTLSLLGLVPPARAQDDHTGHLWTAEEIASGNLVEGHPFFDYDGWYEARKRSRDDAG